MTPDERRDAARRMTREADRLDELADVAELMGDDPTALGFRASAARHRERAIGLLD